MTSANDSICDIGINRRVFVVGAGSAVMGLGLLTAACDASGGSATPGNPTAPTSANGGVTPTSAEPAAPTSAVGPNSAAAAKPAVKKGTPLGKAAAVPVGGGAVFAAQKVVVTQPQAGRYVGLSAVCTHEGRIVGSVAGGTINCPCHGSRYHLDGTVARGPAARALASRPSPLSMASSNSADWTPPSHCNRVKIMLVVGEAGVPSIPEVGQSLPSLAVSCRPLPVKPRYDDLAVIGVGGEEAFLVYGVLLAH